MRESEAKKSEQLQFLDETIPSPHGNDPSDMDIDNAATSSTLRFHSNGLIENNRYHSIALRQQESDQVEHNFVGNSEIEPTENENVIPITCATMIYVLCAALNSCNLGYDIGVSTNVSKLIQNDIHITDTQREIWIGFINFWASKLSVCTVYVLATHRRCCLLVTYVHAQLTKRCYRVHS